LHIERPETWELGWLALVLRDFEDEMLTVGFGAAKGFGRARLASLSAQIGCLTAQDWQALLGQPAPAEAELDGLYQCVTYDASHWRAMAETWVQAFHNKRKDFRRASDIHLREDTYFDGNLSTLYDKEAYQCLLMP
jgi:hypothetical protein